MDWKPFRSLLTSLALCLVFGIVLHKLTWLGMPTRMPSGLIDSRTVWFSLGSLLALFLFLPKKTGRYLGAFVGFIMASLVVTNWFHVAFYRDILVPSSLNYGIDALDGLSTVASLGPVWSGIAGILICTILGWLAATTWFASSPTKGHLLLAFVLGALAFHSGVRFHSEYPDSLPVGGMHPVAGFMRAAFLPTKPGPTPEQIHALSSIKTSTEAVGRNVQFPLFDVVGANQKAGITENSPHNVIIVVMESIRSSETSLTDPSLGTTPNLVEIAKQTTLYTNFYANTTQTVRAEMAILCSTLDFNRGAPLASTGLELKNRCLPKILADNGYSTHWFHGNESSFFNRDQFLPQTGISDLHDENRLLQSQPMFSTLGWGILDTEMFDYSLEKLEQTEGPFFAEILTVSNHYPFEWDWDSTGVDFSPIEGDKILSNYHKGIYYTDHAVGKFWEKFKNSRLYDNTIVFFVGDHGIWLFDESTDAAQGEFLKNEQYARVPLLTYVPGTRKENKTSPASQLDIAPTILSLLNISDQSAFLGRNLSQVTDKDSLIVLTKIGAAGFRKGETACYASQSSCDSKYQKCDISRNYKTVCGLADLESDLYGSLIEPTQQLNTDMSIAQHIMNYSNAAHRFGFVPTSALQSPPPPIRLEFSAKSSQTRG